MWGTEFDQGNFQRKVRSEPDFVRDLGRTTDPSGSRGRPAALFSAGEVSRLEQPFLAMRLESRLESRHMAAPGGPLPMEPQSPPPPSTPSRDPDDYPAWLAGSDDQEPDDQPAEKE